MAPSIALCATAETSYYSVLEALLNAIGHELKPRVLCLSQLADQGAGHPDFGLYTANQCQRGEPRTGAMPERGVVEVKPIGDDAWLTAETRQIPSISTVTVWFSSPTTNYRDFLLIGDDAGGRAAKLESFGLAQSAQAFWEAAATPRRTAGRLGLSFLRRVLTQRGAARAEGRRLVPCVLCPRRARPGRAGGRSAGARRRALATTSKDRSATPKCG